MNKTFYKFGSSLDKKKYLTYIVIYLGIGAVVRITLCRKIVESNFWQIAQKK